MSIYATYWSLRFPVTVRCTKKDADSRTFWEGGPKGGVYSRERWILVTAQSVPAHIGHPAEYPDGDPYAGLLPPVAEYDPDDWDTAWTPRAVIIVDEDHREKDRQCYTEPLLVLAGAEYEAMTFEALHGRIEDALEARFGVKA